MEQPSNSKIFTSCSTQTEFNSNKGNGLDPLDQSKHENLFDAHNDLPTPLYRENFNKVFNEEFLAEASQRELKPIIDLVKTQNWDDLKKVNPLYFRIRRDLSVTETNCLLYDNRLLIPQKLKHLVIDTIHHKHPGQVGMLALAKLIWWPHIHSEIVAKAKACRHCIDKGENLKPIIPKNQLGDLPKLNEPNEEIQMDFAGPIPYKKSTQNNYILVTVDRLSRFPHAETFHNCDTETAIDYLEKYCKLHGIPRSLRCDQAQAFKAKEFDIFCKNKNIKLILAPAGDHRGTGMVERLIQTIKRRLAVLDIDPNWSSETLSSRLANIIENIRLIPNRTTKITPFEAHFGRKPNTALSNMLTKPAIKNLSYHKLKSRCLEKRTLKHDVLSQEEMWRLDGRSEDELDIQYKQDENPTSAPQQIDSDDSENLPLSRSSPSKISPSEIHFSIGDKTTKIVYNKKNVARKSIARKTKEPRNTLAPQWTLIPDGTITNYTPHTITIDTPQRKNTVIRKNDIAIATETKPIPEKPRLILMVACKTVGEYKRNQEKIRKFCLDEAKKQKATNQPLGTKRTREAINSTINSAEPSSSTANINEVPGTTKTRNKESNKTPGSENKPTSNKANTNQTKKKHTLTKKNNSRTIWSRDKLIQIATKNQRQQQSTIPKTPKGVSKAKTKHSTPLANFKASCNSKQQRTNLHAEKHYTIIGHRYV